MSDEITTTKTETQTGVLFCTNHPQVETTLRCNRCERPICARCARLTPTGYRCKDCVRGMQKQFETALWYDYPLAFIVTAGLSFVGSLITSFIGFFTILLAPVAGMLIAEAARAVIRRRRSKRLFQVIALAAVAGTLPMLLYLLLPLVFGGGLGSLLSLVWQGLYAFTVASSVYYRLGGIQIR